MTQLLNDLHKDHINISALLTILKNKLATLKAGRKPNFGLMAEVVDYLGDYGDNYHHAKENLIYHYIEDRFPKKTNIIHQQMKEHDELKILTEELGNSVNQVLMDVPIQLEEFIEQLHQFIEKQGQHLNHEECKVFPLIEQCLSIDDWKYIASSLPDREDPLFGKEREERYNALYEALIEDLT
ncbi:MAG: hemerythrin domain-containing protein [Motiliproteus sp.]|nr:hemerythrin domain-containing protein [Motiliproteus sp.]MCW9051150.1 hemerythrin domain-containing protein [Motiliproteus sp.]